MTPTAPDLLQDKFAGALLGTFVGDALGAPVEGWSTEGLEEALAEFDALPPGSPKRELQTAIMGQITGAPLPPGSAYYTDDTQMTIGVAESLAECGDFDGPDLARRFAENFEGSRGYGPGGYSAIRAFRSGVPWNEAATKLYGPEGSYGNGGAMRVAPVGVFFHDDADALRRVAEATASLTHAHPLGKEGAALQAYAVALATRSDPSQPLDAPAFLASLRSFTRDATGTFTAKLDAVEELLATSPNHIHVAETLGVELTAHESVPAAIYSFLAHPHDFAAAVTYAVMLGGDADTIGAMTGAIAGAFLGMDAIPERWISPLENGPKGRDYMIGLADRLYWQYTARTRQQ